METPIFSETIIAPGSVLYKGLPGVQCYALLKNTKAFYLTDNPATAAAYGIKCSYRAKKTLRLFDMSQKNLKLLFQIGGLTPRTKRLLQLSFGTGLSLKDQVAAIGDVVKDKSLRRVKEAARTGVPGQRASYLDLDKRMDEFFIKEFLAPSGYDGYYATGRHTVFHKGKFRAEIMLNNAYQKIERAGPTRLPVVSLAELQYPQTISRLFLEYCRKKNTPLSKSHREFTIFCTGGQALNLYLRRKLKNIPQVVRKTYDFDLSFAVPSPLKSVTDVVQRIERMRLVMIELMNGFVAFVNKNYMGANAKLRMTKVYRKVETHPAVQIPATGRRVYCVFTWQIVIGKAVVDVCDSALAVYPGVTSRSLDSEYTAYYGVPIQKVEYQFRDLAALLSGSFLYKNQIIFMRNPLKGQKANKGLRNTWRMKALLPMVKRNVVSNAVRPLVNKILNKNFSGAEKASLSVNRALRSKRVMSPPVKSRTLVRTKNKRATPSNTKSTNGSLRQPASGSSVRSRRRVSQAGGH